MTDQAMSKSDMERAEAFFDRCGECDGIGEVEQDFEFHECKNCKGAGELQPTSESIASLIQEVRNETLDNLCTQISKRKNEALKQLTSADNISALAHHYEFSESLVRSLKSQTQQSKEGEGK